MLAYTGIETVSNMAEEARDPGKDVPKAVNLILIAVLGVYAGMTVVALSALPVIGHGSHANTLLGQPPPHGYQNDPVLGIIEHLGLAHAAASALRYYVGILAATILFIATNAGLIGISRLSWSLAEHRQLPSMFAQLHKRHRTPWFTIVMFSVFAGILLIPGQTNFLGNLYSFGAMLSFTTAHAAVIALRFKDPDRERPYRMPGNIRVRGRDLPMTAVIGGIGTFAAWVSVIDPARRRPLRRHRLDDRRAGRLRRSTAGARGWTWSATTRSRAASGPRSSSSSSTARRSCRSSAPTSTPRPCARRPSSSARARSSRRSTCCAFPTSCRSTPASRRRRRSG